MSCDVSTGTLFCDPPQTACENGGQYRSAALFNANSISRFSTVVELRPGDSAIVSVFDLAGGALYVNKVALSTGLMPQGVMCPTSCDELGVTSNLLLPPGLRRLRLDGLAAAPFELRHHLRKRSHHDGERV
jgi:hypothetical protein